tara:strand:- start:6021 stop:7028 length:1008 start_codon:yes stop_codon:yes gene_type:complete
VQSLKELILIANELDKRGLSREADKADTIIKLAYGWSDLVSDVKGAGSSAWSGAQSAGNWVADTASDAASATKEVVWDTPARQWSKGFGTTMSAGAEEGAFGEAVQMVHSGEFQEQFAEWTVDKANQLARSVYGSLLALDGRSLLLHILDNLPRAISTHTFGGGNNSLVWDNQGVHICGHNFADMIRSIADIGQIASNVLGSGIYGFSGDPFQPLYNQLSTFLNQYPTAMFAIDLAGSYQNYASMLETLGLYDHVLESSMWGAITNPLNDISMPGTNTPIMSEAKKYCDLINNPSIPAIAQEAEALASAHGIDLEPAKALVGERINAWKWLLDVA